MKVLQPVPVRVLASRIIPSVDPGLAAAFKLEPRHRALALFTSDSDDVSYIAIDEATKKGRRGCRLRQLLLWRGGPCLRARIPANL